MFLTNHSSAFLLHDVRVGVYLKVEGRESRVNVESRE